MRAALILLLITFGCLCSPGAMFAPAEGYARINVFLSSPQIVICQTHASGRPNTELVALNPTNGVVLWRQQTGELLSATLTDSHGAFFTFAADFIQKRSLQTGNILWQTPLIIIPEQKTPPRPPRRSLREYWEDALNKVKLRPSRPTLVTFSGHLGSIPNHYAYQPFLFGSQIAVFRDAYESSGCTRYSCFNDWLLFDLQSGKFKSGGSGELLAATDSTALFQNQTDICVLTSNKLSFLDVDGSGSFFWGRRDQLQKSCNGRAMFHQSESGSDQIYIFDGKSDVTSFRLPSPTNYQFSSVLLSNSLLRYTECRRYSETPDKSLLPRFELYDLNGKLLGKTGPIRVSSKTETEEWWLKFCGIAQNGDMIFNTSCGPANAGRGALTIPGLNWKPLPDAQEGDEVVYDRSAKIRDPRRIYQTDGEIMLWKMKKAKVSRDLTLSALNAKTKKPLWKHVEKVVIERVH